MGAQSASGARFVAQKILRFSAAKNVRVFGFGLITSQPGGASDCISAENNSYKCQDQS